MKLTTLRQLCVEPQHIPVSASSYHNSVVRDLNAAGEPLYDQMWLLFVPLGLR